MDTARHFSLLITTHNRLEELKFTLNTVEILLEKGVEIIICDDGSTDGTAEFLKKLYPQIKVIRNNKNQGLIFSRNRLMSHVKTQFAITLDDDAHLLTEDPFEIIQSFFYNHPACAVIAFRIFWGKEGPLNTKTAQKSERVKGFVGCGHVWRMESWLEIPEYPRWFVFYGEEEFASLQLFKKSWEVHYLPTVLVHHRVEMKSRKSQKDYSVRLRRSLRAGWYLYFLFYPWQKIPRKMVYSIWMQIKLKVFKGDLEVLISLILGFWDLIYNLPRLLKNRNSLSNSKYQEYLRLNETKIYWDGKK